MAIAPLTPLVEPPTQATPAAQWPDLADAFVTDQYRWTLEFNAQTIPQMNETVTEVNSGAAASADNVIAAQQAADQAETHAADALAEADRAEDYKDAALAAAEAAQAGAGIPDPEGNSGYSLTVQPNGLVGWSDVSQKVGDVLFSANPTAPAGYLGAGSIFLRAAYPLLAPKCVDIPDGLLWTSISTGGSSGSPGALTDGTVIVGDRRSVDRGLTWAPIVGPSALPTIATNDLDLMVSISLSSSGVTVQVRVSVDKGVTWAAGTNISGQGNAPKVSVSKTGTVIVTGNGIFRSIDKCATWTQVATGITSAVDTDDAGVWMAVSNNGSEMRISRDDGASWTPYIRIEASSTLSAVSHIEGSNWIVGSATSTRRSSDSGRTWSPVSSAPISSVNANCAFLPGGLFGICGEAAANGLNIGITYDGGNNWTAHGPLIEGTITKVVNPVYAGEGVFIGALGGSIIRGVVQFSYDRGSQFRVPRVKAPAGYHAYVKALEG